VFFDLFLCRLAGLWCKPPGRAFILRLIELNDFAIAFRDLLLTALEGAQVFRMTSLMRFFGTGRGRRTFLKSGFFSLRPYRCWHPVL